MKQTNNPPAPPRKQKEGMIRTVRESNFLELKHMNVQPERSHLVNEKSLRSER